MNARASEASLASAPLTADMIRLRALVTQRKAEHRLTAAETIELAHVVRDSIELLASLHSVAPDFRQVFGILESCNVQPEFTEDDRIEVRCDGIEGQLNLGLELAKHATREARFLIERAQWEPKTGCVWWQRRDFDERVAA